MTDQNWKHKLDFTVKADPVFYFDNKQPVGSFERWPNRVGLRREDNGAPLGIVSERSYKLVQPAEIIAFYDEFARAGGMTLVDGGAFKGGERIWTQAELDKPIKLPGNDIIFPRFTLSTSYNGDTGTIGSFGSNRVICMNSLNIALRVAQKEAEESGNYFVTTGFSIPHHREFNVQEAQRHVEELIAASGQFEAQALQLTQFGVSLPIEFFTKLVGKLDKGGTDLTSQSRTKIDRLMQLYLDGPGAQLESAKGTAWGLLNAATFFVDHETPTRAGNDRRFAAWFGEGRKLKAQAFQAALELTA